MARKFAITLKNYEVNRYRNISQRVDGWFSPYFTILKYIVRFRHLNPFTLESSSRSIVCYFHTFGNNLGIKRNFAKYFKESCCLSSDEHFSFNYFHENAFISKIFPKSSGLFWPL